MESNVIIPVSFHHGASCYDEKFFPVVEVLRTKELNPDFPFEYIDCEPYSEYIPVTNEQLCDSHFDTIHIYFVSEAKWMSQYKKMFY